MDLRTERTRRSIINAFMELRSRKPIEKITIKELAELAVINKATFYSHYQDIYDLSEYLENETLDKIITDIPHLEELMSNPGQAAKALTIAFVSEKQLIDILFSGSRAAFFASKLEERIKKKIYDLCPEYRNDLERDIILTYLIQGGIHVFLEPPADTQPEELLDIIGRIGDRMMGYTEP